MIWDINSSQYGMLMIVCWGIIVLLIMMIAKLWVSLVVDVIFDIWLFVVVNPTHNGNVMRRSVVSILMWVLLVMLNLVMRGLMMLNIVGDWLRMRGLMMLNIVVDWLMDDFMVHLMVDWLMNNSVVNWFMMDFVMWLIMVRSLVVNWGLMVEFNMLVMFMMRLDVVLGSSPLSIMNWVVLLVMGNFVMVIVCPGLVVVWLLMVGVLEVMFISPSIMVSIMLMFLMGKVMISVMLP
jgi:hypothetical protein